jgi:Fe2+ transport system protein FeoA
MQAPLTPLTEVSAGVTCTIAQIDAPPEIRPRLMELGLVPGTKIELVRFAPLGDPVDIRVRGYHLSLRKHEAAQVLVSVDS